MRVCETEIPIQAVLKVALSIGHPVTIATALRMEAAAFDRRRVLSQINLQGHSMSVNAEELSGKRSSASNTVKHVQNTQRSLSSLVWLVVMFKFTQLLGYLLNF